MHAERIAGRVVALPISKRGQAIASRVERHLHAEGDRLVVGPPAELPDVLTLEQAASLFQVDVAAIQALAEANELPGRRIGGAWRFAREALLDWLARRH